MTKHYWLVRTHGYSLPQSAAKWIKPIGADLDSCKGPSLDTIAIVIASRFLKHRKQNALFADGLPGGCLVDEGEHRILSFSMTFWISGAKISSGASIHWVVNSLGIHLKPKMVSNLWSMIVLPRSDGMFFSFQQEIVSWIICIYIYVYTQHWINIHIYMIIYIYIMNYMHVFITILGDPDIWGHHGRQVVFLRSPGWSSCGTAQLIAEKNRYHMSIYKCLEHIPSGYLT